MFNIVFIHKSRGGSLASLEVTVRVAEQKNPNLKKMKKRDLGFGWLDFIVRASTSIPLYRESLVILSLARFSRNIFLLVN